MTYLQEDGTATELSSFYRPLFEDNGVYVWTTLELKPFLEREYKRLILPREIHLTQYQGETLTPYSVFVLIRKRTDRVILRAIWPGQDALENLKKHIRLFRKRNLLISSLKWTLESHGRRS